MLDSVRAVLSVEGAATFATNGPDGPHLVATWQSYIEVVDRETIIFPAGGYRVTESNLATDPTIQMIVGSRTGSSALGFRIRGTAALESGTELHDRLKGRFPWCRAAVVVRITAIEQILGG